MGNHTYIIGVDEVGRGPVAGPVTVGAVCLPVSFDSRLFEGIKDSKKLSPKKREAWFDVLKKLEQEHTDIAYAVSSVSEEIIDTKGIAFALRKALAESLSMLAKNPNNCLVLLDGGLKAPEEFIYQETIIKGDEKEYSIALASIAAKVTRDLYMVALGEQYPEYAFETHKGYGTKLHYERIREYGVCPAHRKSFLSRL